jgi:hypothetical protein
MVYPGPPAHPYVSHSSRSPVFAPSEGRVKHVFVKCPRSVTHNYVRTALTAFRCMHLKLRVSTILCEWKGLNLNPQLCQARVANSAAKLEGCTVPVQVQ